MNDSRPIILVPGDDPPQIQGSAHLDRLREHGEVVLYDTRPKDAVEQLARARGAAIILNSRGQVKWPAELLRELPELRMMTVCGIGTDAIDLAAASELGVVVCNIPGRTAPVVADCTVSASFIPDSVVTYVVTPVAGAGGALAPSSPQEVVEGGSVAFEVTPLVGHAIDTVAGCGGELDGNTFTTAAVTADCTVTAEFVVIDPVFADGFD